MKNKHLNLEYISDFITTPLGVESYMTHVNSRVKLSKSHIAVMQVHWKFLNPCTDHMGEIKENHRDFDSTINHNEDYMSKRIGVQPSNYRRTCRQLVEKGLYIVSKKNKYGKTYKFSDFFIKSYLDYSSKIRSIREIEDTAQQKEHWVQMITPLREDLKKRTPPKQIKLIPNTDQVDPKQQIKLIPNTDQVDLQSKEGSKGTSNASLKGLAEPAKLAGPKKKNLLSIEKDKLTPEEFNQFREMIRNAGGFLGHKNIKPMNYVISKYIKNPKMKGRAVNYLIEEFDNYAPQFQMICTISDMKTKTIFLSKIFDKVVNAV